MILHGLQKMTLLDYPGKVACTVFTGGCNFRCPFCHNALLVTELHDAASFSEDEILDFLQKRKGLLDGVCITGGEPLISDEIFDFIVKIKDLGFSLKIDTNGSYPDRLEYIIKEKLADYIAMDIKNSRDLYAKTIGVEAFDLSGVEKSVELLLKDEIDYEFRTTVVKNFHTVESISNAAEWIKGAKRYFLQNFIDSGNLIGSGIEGVSKETMIKMQNAAEIYIPNTCLRGI